MLARGGRGRLSETSVGPTAKEIRKDSNASAAVLRLSYAEFPAPEVPMRVHVITFCFVVSVAGSSAVAVSAESMSSAEQEVWSGEQRYWDLRAAGKIDEYMNLWLDEFTGW